MEYERISQLYEKRKSVLDAYENGFHFGMILLHLLYVICHVFHIFNSSEDYLESVN